jgi:hypothetical protein
MVGQASCRSEEANATRGVAHTPLAGAFWVLPTASCSDKARRSRHIEI